ncbi:MAG TPA: hypothetical protein PLU24_01550 [Candidatus Omnitrophota bacterium]|nr:hypothetical protein [Candidatus Omnitrophota bacterium]
MKKLTGLIFLILLLSGILGIVYLIYVSVKAIFAYNAVVGLLFVFFLLPFFGRLLFLIFFGIFSSIFTLLFLGSRQKRYDKVKTNEKDDIIDVKGKVVK